MTRMTRKHFEVIAAAVKKASRRNNPPFGSPWDEGYIALHNVFTYTSLSTELNDAQKEIVKNSCEYINKLIPASGADKVSALRELTDRLCVELALTNEFFDADRFKEACK